MERHLDEDLLGNPVAGRPFLTRRSERREGGRAVRERVPLEALAEVAPTAARPDPIDLLTAQDPVRQQWLIPIRHGRMSATAFTFYRGAAAVMASDLSLTPSTGLRVQLCGDAHLSNFGLFNGPDRRLLFDVNDFDETLPGPFEWDVKRLAASVTVAGRDLGLDPEAIEHATRGALAGYRHTLTTASRLSPLDLHSYRQEVDDIVEGLGAKNRKRMRRITAKAARKDSLRALQRHAEVVDDRWRIVPDPPLVTRIDDRLEGDLRARMAEFFEGYLHSMSPHRRAVIERYGLVDLAHKVVGVGSVGTRCYIGLLAAGDGEPLFLQFKEATASVLEPYVAPCEVGHAGERVVRGQRLIQGAGDVFLGWSSWDAGGDGSSDFYVRQLWDGKGSLPVENFGPKRLHRYAWHCGAALALAHARTGDPSAIVGYIGGGKAFDRALVAFSAAYADLAERDHEWHVEAIAEGRIPAVSGV